MYIEEQVMRLTQYFISFCHKNPDLCPHDWEFSWCRKDNDTAKTSGYKCPLCGAERTVQLIRQEDESDYDWERRY